MEQISLRIPGTDTYISTTMELTDIQVTTVQNGWNNRGVMAKIGGVEAVVYDFSPPFFRKQEEKHRVAGTKSMFFRKGEDQQYDCFIIDPVQADSLVEADRLYIF